MKFTDANLPYTAVTAVLQSSSHQVPVLYSLEMLCIFYMLYQRCNKEMLYRWKASLLVYIFT